MNFNKRLLKIFSKRCWVGQCTFLLPCLWVRLGWRIKPVPGSVLAGQGWARRWGIPWPVRSSGPREIGQPAMEEGLHEYVWHSANCPQGWWASAGDNASLVPPSIHVHQDSGGQCSFAESANVQKQFFHPYPYPPQFSKKAMFLLKCMCNFTARVQKPSQSLEHP